VILRVMCRCDMCVTIRYQGVMGFCADVARRLSCTDICRIVFMPHKGGPQHEAVSASPALLATSREYLRLLLTRVSSHDASHPP
jgi:hypothetical protein